MNDKIEITEVINRYFAALDQRQFEPVTFSKIFTDEAMIIRPNGAVLTGPEAIYMSHASSMERFRATQHLTSGFIINIAASKADFRLNVVAMHFWKDGMGEPGLKPDDNHFTAGGVVSGTVVKTGNDWRILTIRNDVVWRKGVGFSEILNTK